MERNWMRNDRIIDKIGNILEECSEALEMKVSSIVLYGSRARGDRNSQSSYEIMVLVEEETKLYNFVRFNNSVKLQLLKEKLLFVEILVYTPGIFEDILYNDKVVGTFLYMLCMENIILYDKSGSFASIVEHINDNEVKDGEVFIQQCIEFARQMGSEKWAQKWEKTLMQYNYRKKRKDF